MAKSQSTDELPPIPVVTGVEFRPHPEFPRYLIGSDGTLWSCRGNDKKNVWVKLRSRIDVNGYVQVYLSLDGVMHYRKMHRLVLEAFVGRRPEGMEARHYPDANRTNNALSNLQWGTRKENARDRFEHGKTYRGESHPSSKLTESDVVKIRKLLAEGMGCRTIGRMFGVTKSAIRFIDLGETWKHVP